jgi:hypothetical protein
MNCLHNTFYSIKSEHAGIHWQRRKHASIDWITLARIVDIHLRLFICKTNLLTWHPGQKYRIRGIFYSARIAKMHLCAWTYANGLGLIRYLDLKLLSCFCRCWRAKEGTRLINNQLFTVLHITMKLFPLH